MTKSYQKSELLQESKYMPKNTGSIISKIAKALFPRNKYKQLLVMIILFCTVYVLALYNDHKNTDPDGIVVSSSDEQIRVTPLPELDSSAALVEEVIAAEVIDGDPIKLIDGTVVRYIGIDAPKTNHPTKKKECREKQSGWKKTFQKLIATDDCCAMYI